MPADGPSAPSFASMKEGLSAARSLHDAGDITAAVAVWRRLIAQAPDEPVPYNEAGTLLRQAGQFDLADRFFEDGMTRCPDDAALAVGYAWTAHLRGDFPVAQQRWATVRARFPTEPYGLTGASVSAREAGDLDRAERFIAEAREVFPGADSTAIEYARLAVARGDRTEALARWEAARQQFPDHPVVLAEGAQALRAAGLGGEDDALIDAHPDLLPASRIEAITHASQATDRGEWDAAAASWAAIRTRWPNEAPAYTRGASCLMELGQLGEAETVLREAVRRFPESAEALTLHGWLAQRRENWIEAGARYEALRQAFPMEWMGYFGGAQVLLGQHLISVAEALLELGMQRLPDNEMLALDYARIPIASPIPERRDPAAAVRRAEALRQRFPAFAGGWILGIECLIVDRRMPEAEALATEARLRFPNEATIALLHASTARDLRRDAEALERYRGVLERFGAMPEALAGFASVLIAQRRTVDADRVLTQALRGAPDSRALLVEFARSASRSEDWDEALRRWEAVQDKFPRDVEIQKRVYETRVRLAETGEQDGSDRIGGAAGTAGQDRDFVLHFESLGGTGLGCEFGLFQRWYGAEPLSLLRWADLDIKGLIAALETRFEGVGEEENTEIVERDTEGKPEYWTRDRRHWMMTRCYVAPEQMPIDKMLTQAMRRLRFLARELIADLAEGAKIFVYRNMFRDLTDDELRDLHRAVRSYGDSTLLYVRFADQDHPHGTVVAPQPGLLVGYIEHFAFSPENRKLPPAIDYWMDVCRNAYALWQRAADQTSTGPAAKERKAR